MGKYSVARVAANVRNSIGENSKLLMITDSDGDIEGTRDKFRRITDFSDDELIIIDDKIEVWLEEDNENLREVFRKLNFNEKREIIKEKIDMNADKNQHDSLNRFLEIISSL